MNKPRLLLPMILLSLPFLCTTVIRAQERPTKDRNQTIKVDVDLVLVNATVSDSQGRMVTESCIVCDQGTKDQDFICSLKPPSSF